MSGTVRPDIDAATAAIGERLAEMRSARRMKVSELARQAGVSSSLISQIERGTSKPSVGSLFALAQVLGVPVDSFFDDGGGPTAAQADAVPAGHQSDAKRAADSGILEMIRDVQSGRYRHWNHGITTEREVVRYQSRAGIDIRGGVRWERLTSTPLDGLEFLELIYAPGAESDSQAYRHPGVELVLVTQGMMTIFLGFEQHDLRPGDSISFASSTPHRYVNLTDGETRAVTVILRDSLSTLPIREDPGTEPADARG